MGVLGGKSSTMHLPILVALTPRSSPPSTTSIFTLAWLSVCVLKLIDLFAGNDELRGIMIWRRGWPVDGSIARIPRSCELTLVTETFACSPECPSNMPAYNAAPCETASSGDNDRSSSMPDRFSSSSRIIGIRVEPPTKINRVRSLHARAASSSTKSTVIKVRSTKSSVSVANSLWLNSVRNRSPSCANAMATDSRCVSACLVWLALRNSSCSPQPSSRGSTPCSSINFSAMKSTMRRSQSRPPK